MSCTKFHHILSCLPEHIACDSALDTVEEDYENLKKAIIENLSGNKHELIEQALSAVPLGDKRPTRFINKFKRKFSKIGLTLEEDIKSRVISALPSNIKAALIGQEKERLDSFAQIADSMLAVAGNSSHPYHICAVQAEEREYVPKFFFRFIY